MRNAEHARAVGLMAAAALCWSLGGLLIKSVAWPPLAVAGGRGFIAAAFLAVFAPRFRFTWSAAQIGGAVAYAATTILFVTANKLTTAANAILLQYTAPVWIALLGAWFLGERATRVDWLTIAAVFGGMTLFFCDNLQFAGFAGNLTALASGVAFAAMTLLLRKQKDTSAVNQFSSATCWRARPACPSCSAAASRRMPEAGSRSGCSASCSSDSPICSTPGPSAM